MNRDDYENFLVNWSPTDIEKLFKENLLPVDRKLITRLEDAQAINEPCYVEGEGNLRRPKYKGSVISELKVYLLSANLLSLLAPESRMKAKNEIFAAGNKWALSHSFPDVPEESLMEEAKHSFPNDYNDDQRMVAITCFFALNVINGRIGAQLTPNLRLLVDYLGDKFKEDNAYLRRSRKLAEHKPRELQVSHQGFRDIIDDLSGRLGDYYRHLNRASEGATNNTVYDWLKFIDQNDSPTGFLLCDLGARVIGNELYKYGIDSKIDVKALRVFSSAFMAGYPYLRFYRSY